MEFCVRRKVGWESPHIPYPVIDAVMARSRQDSAARIHPLFAWIIMQDLPENPGAFVARLVSDTPLLRPVG